MKLFTTRNMVLLGSVAGLSAFGILAYDRFKKSKGEKGILPAFNFSSAPSALSSPAPQIAHMSGEGRRFGCDNNLYRSSPYYY